MKCFIFDLLSFHSMLLVKHLESWNKYSHGALNAQTVQMRGGVPESALAAL